MLAFWLVLAYDLLEDRCTIDVIITKFSLCHNLVPRVSLPCPREAEKRDPGNEVASAVLKWRKVLRIVQFRIRLDRWLKALRTHLYRVNLDLK